MHACVRSILNIEEQYNKIHISTRLNNYLDFIFSYLLS